MHIRKAMIINYFPITKAAAYKKQINVAKYYHTIS
jgi:hypothetical protein